MRTPDREQPMCFLTAAQIHRLARIVDEEAEEGLTGLMLQVDPQDFYSGNRGEVGYWVYRSMPHTTRGTVYWRLDPSGIAGRWSEARDGG